jgi:hypothetical protein
MEPSEIRAPGGLKARWKQHPARRLFIRSRRLTSWVLRDILQLARSTSATGKVAIIYDFTRHPMSIGDFLGFSYASVLLSERHGQAPVDLLLILDTKRLLRADELNSPFNPINRLTNAASMMPVILFNRRVANLHLFCSHADFADFLAASPDYAETYPPLATYATGEFLFYRIISDLVIPFWRDRGALPRLDPEIGMELWAKSFMARRSTAELRATVQLRSHPETQPERNSDLRIWRTFFQKSHGNYPVHFFIISSSSEDMHRFDDLPGVTVCKSHGTRIDQDLALVRYCDFHMGMGSGPLIPALFSGVPFFVPRGETKAWEAFSVSTTIKGVPGVVHQPVFGHEAQFASAARESIELLEAALVHLLQYVERTGNAREPEPPQKVGFIDSIR